MHSKPATQSRQIQEGTARAVRFAEDENVPTASTSQIELDSDLDAQAVDVERSSTLWAGALPAAVSSIFIQPVYPHVLIGSNLLQLNSKVYMVCYSQPHNQASASDNKICLLF